MNIKLRLLTITCLALSSSGQAAYYEQEAPFERERSSLQRGGFSSLLSRQRVEFCNDQRANEFNAQIAHQLRSKKALKDRGLLEEDTSWYGTMARTVTGVIKLFNYF